MTTIPNNRADHPFDGTVWYYLATISQVLCTCLVYVLTAWGNMPMLTRLALVVSNLALIHPRAVFLKYHSLCSRWISSFILAGLGTAIISALMQGGLSAWIDSYYAWIVWLTAANSLLALSSKRPKAETSMLRTLFSTACFIALLIHLADAYLRNSFVAFHAALFLMVVWLIHLRLSYRLNTALILTVHSLILLALLLPLVDVFLRPSTRLGPHPEDLRLYNPHVAKMNPDRFALWWNCYLNEWDHMAKDIFTSDPRHIMPLRLKPGSSGRLFESTVRINNLGFRGPEISLEKGQAYRIVILGESTTMGCTLHAHDQPWPELLEEKIRSRLHPRRPIQVINAGTPACNLEHNLSRLENDIFPLQPDLVISYHGFNGFSLFRETIKGTQLSRPPAYRSRPLYLLARAEYRAKMFSGYFSATVEDKRAPITLPDLISTRYGQAYSQLHSQLHSHHIRVVLADFSMAVNRHSSPETIEFYALGFPSVHWLIRANEFHTELVRKFSALHAGTIMATSQTGLDGHDEHFIDLVHLTQSGREQLAENIYNAIKDHLASLDL